MVKDEKDVNLSLEALNLNNFVIKICVQFTGVAKSLFPFAKKPAVTDVYAGQAHWLVIASANGMTTASDWQSAMVVKDSTGAYAVSREHADLHNEIRQAVSSSSQ